MTLHRELSSLQGMYSCCSLSLNEVHISEEEDRRMCYRIAGAGTSGIAGKMYGNRYSQHRKKTTLLCTRRWRFIFLVRVLEVLYWSGGFGISLACKICRISQVWSGDPYRSLFSSVALSSDHSYSPASSLSCICIAVYLLFPLSNTRSLCLLKRILAASTSVTEIDLSCR